MPQRLNWSKTSVPPVTLKNNQRHDTLYLAQGLIMLSTAIIIWLSITQTYLYLIAIPAIIGSFIRNHKTIQKNKQFNIVMNAECEWRLVQIDTSKVTEVQLKAYWVTPVFLMMHLRTKKQNFHCLVIRRQVEDSAYSRLLQGVQRKN